MPSMLLFCFYRASRGERIHSRNNIGPTKFGNALVVLELAWAVTFSSHAFPATLPTTDDIAGRLLSDLTIKHFLSALFKFSKI